MSYFRSLILNFLAIFFINHIMPGITIKSFENVPYILSDIIFAGIVGFLNASIFFALVILNIPISYVKMFTLAFIISFVSYFILLIGNFYIEVTVGAFFGAGFLVGLVACFTNYLEEKHLYKK